jgi:hypothetical protein
MLILDLRFSEQFAKEFFRLDTPNIQATLADLNKLANEELGLVSALTHSGVTTLNGKMDRLMGHIGTQQENPTSSGKGMGMATSVVTNSRFWKMLKHHSSVEKTPPRNSKSCGSGP